jgi:predicted CxxxxCH...CXXCH cytochrome family protein
MRAGLIKGIALIAAAMILCSCSTANDDAVELDASGKHQENWFVDHRAAFLSSSSKCSGCHGSDLRGGISRVSCFSPLFNGQTCHAKGPSGHPAGWRDPGLHGATAKSQPGTESGFSSCRNCHGSDFAGGVAGVSCFSASTASGACHVRNSVAVGSPHSPLPWRTYPSPTHTDTVDDAAGSNATVCAFCHTAGRNLRTPIIASYASGTPGCFNSTLCHGVMRHPLGWAQPKNHGETAKSNLAYCQQCHADKPLGGPGSGPRFNVPLGRLSDGANTGCEVCHAQLAAHPRVLQIPSVFGVITTLNPVGTPWYLHCKVSPSGFDACTRCHGADLDGRGGVPGATACTFCHRNGIPNTLKNCTSCHGQPPNGTAYPNTASAHASHSALNVSVICGECHLGLGSVTLDHFLRAKTHSSGVQTGAVQFGEFSKTGGLSPVFNEVTLQCSNTYCHGITLAGGANNSPRWDDTAYLAPAGCGTCHGFPPPIPPHIGFTSNTSCKSCHPNVNASNTGFDDPTRHVNGAVDVVSGAAPHPFPNPGAVHLVAAGRAPFPGCVVSGCHSNSSVSRGRYPVAVGTPPDCQGCHVKASPGNGCGSCHGNSTQSALTNGRPVNDLFNTGTFPDVVGRHGTPHGSFACALCHGSSGTGNSGHGPSNRAGHSDADVIIQFTGEAVGMAFTRSGLGNGRGNCSGSCHGKTHNGLVW